MSLVVNTSGTTKLCIISKYYFTMKKINVLVLGVGGNVGQGIITALRCSKLPIKVIGACISSESLGLYMCDTSYISPYANSEIFIEWLVDICNKESISIIFSGVEEVILALELNKDNLKSKTKSIFISSEIDKLSIGNSKFLTVEFLKQNGLNYPKTANITNPYDVKNLIEECGFPLIAKPNKGKGSVGIIKIKSENELNLITDNDYCIQEYLGTDDNEYTAACYVDKKGKQMDIIIFRRKLKYGTTFMAEIIDNKILKDECRRICEAFKPIGPLNIQLRLHNSVPVCFEMNVRYSGTTPMRARFGYNDVEAMIREYVLDESIDNHFNPSKTGKVYRYFNEFYIDSKMQDNLNKYGCITSNASYNNFQECKK